MDVLSEIWRRVTAVQPAPPVAVVAGLGLLACLLVGLPRLWPYTRMLVTIVHEGGHGVAALLVGRRLRGIRLHTDTSGLTVSSGRPSGPGMVATLLAGYLSPAVVGLAAVVLLTRGHSLALLWVFAVLLALLLLQIRNLYGFVVVVVSLAALVAVSWYLPATAQSALAYLLTWFLLVAAPKPVLELIRQRRRGVASHSDADQLARLTRVPAVAWTTFFLLANLIGIAVGAAVLVPAIVEHLRALAGPLKS